MKLMLDSYRYSKVTEWTILYPVKEITVKSTRVLT